MCVHVHVHVSYDSIIPSRIHYKCTYLAKPFFIDKGSVGTAMVGDSEVAFASVVADRSVRLAHLKLRHFNAVCASGLSVCVCVWGGGGGGGRRRKRGEGGEKERERERERRENNIVTY